MLATLRQQFDQHWNYSILDQLVVSASGIVTTVLLARLLGVEAFGIWAVIILFSLLQSELNRALIIQPMKRHAAGVALVSYLGKPCKTIAIIVLVGTALATTLAVLLLYISDATQLRFPTVLAPLFTFFLLRSIMDMARGIFQAYEQGRDLLIVDSLFAGTLIATLIVITTQRIETGFDIRHALVLYIAITLVIVPPLLSAIKPMVHSNTEARLPYASLWKHHLNFGGWLALANGIKWFGANTLLLASVWFLSASNTGLLRAAISILGPIGIAYQLADTLLFVRVSRLQQNNDYHRANSVFFAGCTLLGALAVVGILFVTLTHSLWLVPLFGPSYTQVGELLPIMGLAYFSLSFVVMAQLKLRLVEKTRALFKANAIIALITVVLCPVYFYIFGIYAFAVGVLVNNIIIVSLVLWIYRRMKHGESVPHYPSL